MTWAGSMPEFAPAVRDLGVSVADASRQMQKAMDALLANRTPVDPQTHLVGLGRARMNDWRVSRDLISPEDMAAVERTQVALGVAVHIADVVAADGGLHTRVSVKTRRGEASVLVWEHATEGMHLTDAWSAAFRALGLIE